MFKELFNAIKSRLDQIKDDEGKPVFKQIDYWNNQYAYADSYKLMQFPHVYVEFTEPEWQPIGKRVQQATIFILLHIGVRTLNTKDVTNQEFINIINYWITGLCGTDFSSLTRTGSKLDQEHDADIMHTSTFKTVVKDRTAVRIYQKVEGDKLEIIQEVSESN